MKYSQHDPLTWIDEELDSLGRMALRRSLRTHTGPQQARLALDGREFVNFGSNDYLALADDARLRQAARHAAEAEGWGAGASPLVTGHSNASEQLERDLADFLDEEAALVFSSGYAANVGTIAALVGRGDAVFSDQKNHASMIDGCRLSRARVHIYPHGDTSALTSQLSCSGGYRRRLIITESVFSMDGDRAPLAALTAMAEQYNAILLVDEAHALGVLGAQGRGLAEELGLESKIHVRVGTLSKALASAGGFVCGSKSLIEWLLNRARPYVFSTALPPAIAAAATAALNIVRREPNRRERLIACADGLRSALRSQGWDLGTSSSHIVPLLVGEASTAVRLSEQLFAQGLLVPAIRPPTVPIGQALLRVGIGYGHTRDMVDRLVDALSALRETLDMAKVDSVSPTAAIADGVRH